MYKENFKALLFMENESTQTLQTYHEILFQSTLFQDII